MNPFKALFLLASAITLVSGCAGQARLDREADAALTEHHTTCLKRRLPIDTPEHSECVAALHRERESQLAKLRGVVTPAAPSSDGDAAAPSPFNDSSPRGY